MNGVQLSVTPPGIYKCCGWSTDLLLKETMWVRTAKISYRIFTIGKVTGEDVGGLQGCKLKLWLPPHEHPGFLYLPTHMMLSG